MNTKWKKVPKQVANTATEKASQQSDVQGIFKEIRDEYDVVQTFSNGQLVGQSLEKKIRFAQ